MNGAPKFRLQFPRQITASVAIVGVLASYPLALLATTEVMNAVIAGVLLSVLNVVMGYAAIEYSFDKSYTHFTQIVLGGIVVRLFVMSGLLLMLILVFKFHTVALVVSLFVMYVIFLTLEVLYIHNKWQAHLSPKGVGEQTKIQN